MKVLLVKNITREGPGLLEDILKKNNIDFDLVDLSKGKKFPDPQNYSAVFVFGGPDSVNDKTAKMLQELLQIKKTIDLKIPYLGVCLGLQTLVKASLGEVGKSPLKEVGWRDPEGKFFEIELTDSGKNDPLFKDLTSPLKVFHLHGETIKDSPKFTILAKGKYCYNQVAKIGTNMYGTQYHFELTPEMFKVWISEDPDLQKLDKSSLQKDYLYLKNEYEKTGKKILMNFLKIAELI